MIKGNFFFSKTFIEQQNEHVVHKNVALAFMTYKLQLPHWHSTNISKLQQAIKYLKDYKANGKQKQSIHITLSLLLFFILKRTITGMIDHR